MNKTLFLALLFVLFSAAMTAQPQLHLYTKAPDTLTSIFGQEEYEVWADPIPVDTVDFFETTPRYEIFVNYQETYFSVKFPGRDWIMVRAEKDFHGSFRAEELFDFRIRDGFSYNEDLNLIPLYEETPGLFDEVKQGSNILVRFQVMARFEGENVTSPFTMYYTEPDTIYLPAANDHDIGAWNYWRSILKQSFRALSYIHGLGAYSYSDSELNHIINTYPESLLAEYAQYFKADYEFTDWLSQTKRTIAEERVKLYEVFHSLYNAKSPIVKRYAHKMP